MKLEEAKKKYAGEWIAFQAHEKGDNPEGEVLLHHAHRREFDRELVKKNRPHVYLTFCGPALPDRYAAIF